MYKFEPTQGKVIVEKIKKVEKVSESGITYELEASEQDLFSRGVVLAIGEPFWDGPVILPINYEVGDTVIFGTYSGKVLENNETDTSEIVVLSMMDIQAKVV